MRDGRRWVLRVVETANVMPLEDPQLTVGLIAGKFAMFGEQFLDEPGKLYIAVRVASRVGIEEVELVGAVGHGTLHQQNIKFDGLLPRHRRVMSLATETTRPAGILFTG